MVAKEGINFVVNENHGVDPLFLVEKFYARNHSLLLSCDTTKMRDLHMPSHELMRIHLAMEFLYANRCSDVVNLESLSITPKS